MKVLIHMQPYPISATTGAGENENTFSVQKLLTNQVFEKGRACDVQGLYVHKRGTGSSVTAVGKDVCGHWSVFFEMF